MSADAVKADKLPTDSKYTKLEIKSKDGKSTITIFDVDGDGFDNHDAVVVKGDASVFTKEDFSKVKYTKTINQEAMVKGDPITFKNAEVADNKIKENDSDNLYNLGSVMDQYGVCDCDSEKAKKETAEKEGQNNNFFSAMSGCCGGFPFMPNASGLTGSSVSLDWGKYAAGAPCISAQLGGIGALAMSGFGLAGIGLSSMIPCMVGNIWETVGTWFKTCNKKTKESEDANANSGKGSGTAEGNSTVIEGEGNPNDAPPATPKETTSPEGTTKPVDKQPAEKVPPASGNKNKYLGGVHASSFVGATGGKMTPVITQKYEIDGKIYYIDWSMNGQTCLGVRNAKGKTLNMVARRPAGWSPKTHSIVDFELVGTPESEKKDDATTEDLIRRNAMKAQDNFD